MATMAVVAVGATLTAAATAAADTQEQLTVEVEAKGTLASKTAGTAIPTVVVAAVAVEPVEVLVVLVEARVVVVEVVMESNSKTPHSRINAIFPLTNAI